MNLDDLRAHLQQQASGIDPADPAPLVAIRRRRTALKRRRAAGVLAGVAAVVAVAIAIVPGVIDTSTPAPAEPPKTITRDGVTIPGTNEAGQLEKAEIGKPGQNPITFSWTPGTDSNTFRPYCSSKAESARSVDVVVNGRVLFNSGCEGVLGEGEYFPPGHVLWTEAPPGRAAEVQLIVRDEMTLEPGDPTAQVALGIYRTPSSSKIGAVVVPPEGGPGDYDKDGIRFRAKASGDSLLVATVGDAGQSSLKLDFTATGSSTGLRTFCTANRAGEDLKYGFTLRVDGGKLQRFTCQSRLSDVASELPDRPVRIQTSPGQSNEVTLEIVDKDGRPANDVPGARLGVGVYELEPPRIVKAGSGETISVDQTVEWQGKTYKLADVKTGNATARSLSIATPAGTQFLLDYSSTELGIPFGRAAITGLPAGTTEEGSPDGDYGPGIGIDNSRYTAPAAAAGTATLKVTEGIPTKGTLVLALYLPE